MVNVVKMKITDEMRNSDNPFVQERVRENIENSVEVATIADLNFFERREDVRKRLMSLTTPVPEMLVVFKLLDEMAAELKKVER